MDYLDIKILNRLFKELWLQSNDGKETIENMWFSISEVSKSTGKSRNDVKKHLEFLIEINILKTVSKNPMRYSFTESGKEIKTESDIEKINIA
ncbi:hypothetical protein ACOSP6_00270 [Tenacibaculum sp. MEBiC06402]|uniref:hypothetical protein n=1 Tax=unclassified Tenacibaculum TaxID=2635139 RepID=UPI003B9CA605